MIEIDADLQGACETLMEHVHSLRGPEARQIKSLKESGVEIGYRRTAFRTFMRREMFVKVPGYKIGDLSREDTERIMGAVFNTFLIPGASMPEIDQVAPDCMRIKQDFVPMIPVERSPGLVSIAGGFDAKVG